MKGKVKFFDEKRGFGFLLGDDNQDYFVHYSDLKMDGRRSLLDGESVQFEPSENEKGRLAKEVRVPE